MKGKGLLRAVFVTFEALPKMDLIYTAYNLQELNGNKESDTIVYNNLNPQTTAMFIRFIPISWYNKISMRIEIFGCPGMAIIDLDFRIRWPKNVRKQLTRLTEKRNRTLKSAV